MDWQMGWSASPESVSDQIYGKLTSFDVQQGFIDFT